MTKPTANRIKNNFILCTGAVVMAIIVYMGVSEIRSSDNLVQFEPITNQIDALEDTMRGSFEINKSIKLNKESVQENMIKEDGLRLIK